MNWKEQLYQDYALDKFSHNYTGEFELARLENWVEQQIIEKLIEDIPDEIELSPDELDGIHQATKSTNELKQQLRDKWL